METGTVDCMVEILARHYFVSVTYLVPGSTTAATSWQEKHRSTAAMTRRSPSRHRLDGPTRSDFSPPEQPRSDDKRSAACILIRNPKTLSTGSQARIHPIRTTSSLARRPSLRTTGSMALLNPTRTTGSRARLHPLRTPGSMARLHHAHYRLDGPTASPPGLPHSRLDGPTAYFALPTRWPYCIASALPTRWSD